MTARCALEPGTKTAPKMLWVCPVRCEVNGRSRAGPPPAACGSAVARQTWTKVSSEPEISREASSSCEVRVGVGARARVRVWVRA